MKQLQTKNEDAGGQSRLMEKLDTVIEERNKAWDISDTARL